MGPDVPTRGGCEWPGPYDRRMAEPILVTVELRFQTDQDPGPLADRVQESVRMIVGRDQLEDFRWRVIPLAPGGRAAPGA